DQLRCDAEPLRQHRDEGGGVALAGRLHIEVEQEPLAAWKLELSAFEREAAGMLQHAGNAEPAILAAPARIAPALLEAVVIGQRERLVEHDLELAAVDGGADRGPVRQLLGPEQV